VGLSLDVIAEAFNARAVLAGAAARQLARRDVAVELAVAEMEEGLERAAALVDHPPSEAAAFQHAILSTAMCIYRHCGVGHIERALTDQLDRSIYGLMWRAQPLDFQQRARRLDSLEGWQRVVAALKARDEHAAERHVRWDILHTRDIVIAGLATLRGEAPDPALMFLD
jgi:DNA-binding GntR family transcriptional regulator